MILWRHLSFYPSHSGCTDLLWLPAAPASTVREKLQAEGKDVAIPFWICWGDQLEP